MTIEQFKKLKLHIRVYAVCASCGRVKFKRIRFNKLTGYCRIYDVRPKRCPCGCQTFQAFGPFVKIAKKLVPLMVYLAELCSPTDQEK